MQPSSFRVGLIRARNSASSGPERVNAATLLVTMLDTSLPSMVGMFTTEELVDAAIRRSAGSGVLDGSEMARMPGGQSRWSAGKDLSWEPLRIERVCEVKYDHMQGRRFRHTAQFRRWRSDKPPRECTYAQLYS